jgi:hypothetical protein
MTRRVPDVLLERYRLNELPVRSMRAIEAMLAADPDLRARLDALDASDAQIASAYAPRLFVRDVPAPPRRLVMRFVLAASVALAAIVIAVSFPRTPAADDDGNRLKGNPGGHPTLAVYRRTAGGSERLADGDVARPGDLLRVGYLSARPAYGLILSIDSRGTVTLHLPPSGDRAVPLTQGKTILLDQAYELDDAPRAERFYFVTAPDAFAVGPVMSAARRAAARPGSPPDALSLAPGLDQTTFAIQKEGRQ